MKFLVAVLIALATPAAHACYDQERLAEQDKISSEYKVLYREIMSAKERMSATNSRSAASNLCQLNRKQEALLREWIDIDNEVKHKCPEFWKYAYSSGNTKMIRQNHETSTRLIESCTRLGL